jgi:hypothetical protein
VQPARKNPIHVVTHGASFSPAYELNGTVELRAKERGRSKARLNLILGFATDFGA